jgi:adenylate cyclase
VTGQLIEAETGGHLWAERYDRDLTDIFVVQDEITASVSAAILPTMERSERERAARKPPENLDAWECYHRGMWHLATIDATEIEKAQSFFRRAIELDPQFAPAYAALAYACGVDAIFFRPQLREENYRLALDYARHAIALDPTGAGGHVALSNAMLNVGRHEEGIAAADLAVSLDPNSAIAYGAQGTARAFGGLPREAIAPLQTAMRLSPFDPRITSWRHPMARAHYLAMDYSEAVSEARQALHASPNYRAIHITLIAALGQLGLIDEAHAAMADALERFGEEFRRRCR